MLVFCPWCSNMLIVTSIPAEDLPSNERYGPEGKAGKNRFECRTCPYQYILDRRYFERKEMKMKEVDDILGGSESWKNVDKAEAKCPNETCDSREAYFRQVQIRSADEPMTSFFKCTACAREWREN